MRRTPRVRSTVFPETLPRHEALSAFGASERRISGMRRQSMLIQLVLLLKLRTAYFARVRLLPVDPLMTKHLLLGRELLSALGTSVLAPLVVGHALLYVVLHYLLGAGGLMGRQVIPVLKLLVAVLALDRHVPVFGSVYLLVGRQRSRA